ncbi:geranylgeranyl diphosphate synthase CrtE [Trichothermofontia sp.]
MVAVNNPQTQADTLNNAQNRDTFDLNTYLADRKRQVEAALEIAVPHAYPETLHAAIRYSLLAGGKRLRPILCLASCELVGGTIDQAMPTACALEMIHTMSLIHDDLPAMDNDDYRRGRLTNHKVYGEAMAILAGDGLLAHAFAWVAQQTQNVPADRVVEVLGRLGQAAGIGGLVSGQVVDLESEGRPHVTLETLHYIHTHKTAALLEVSVVAGAILAGADRDTVQRLSRYAQNIGLAFQIIDDILDITSTQEELGKSIGKDIQAQKVTYPSLLGLEESQRQAQHLIDEAKAQLADWGPAAQPLLALAEFITARKH